MNDDWTPPTDEHFPWGAKPINDDAAEAAAPDFARANVDPIADISQADLRIVDAFFHELALDASEDPSPPTPEEQEDIDALRAFVDRLTATPPGTEI